MACSRFEYVKAFEQDDRCLPGTWIVVRLDGRGFARFVEQHGWSKPHDRRGQCLMDACAESVMREFGGDVVLAYGHSDEYSFLFKQGTVLFGRRASKLVSCVTSHFAASFVFLWPQFFLISDGAGSGEALPLQGPPTFDGRAVCYPSAQHVRDYFAWRQADCHVNCQYNTVFWALVLKGGLSPKEAQTRLKGTLTGDKNEIMFSMFGINYNDLPQWERKGSAVLRELVHVAKTDSRTGAAVQVEKTETVVVHQDIIEDGFWAGRPSLLAEDAIGGRRIHPRA